MSDILFLRHGSYDPGQSVLNDMGKIATSVIAEIILKKFTEHSFTIICSAGPRAIETADILTKLIPISDYKVTPWLLKRHDASTLLYAEAKRRIGSLRTKDDVVLICITNGKFLSDYTSKLCEENTIENPILNLAKNEMCLLRYREDKHVLERLY